jgi:ankyrin repeat protein
MLLHVRDIFKVFVDPMSDVPLSTRVDVQFRSIGLPLHDVNGMMRHILDCMGALKVRLSEELESKSLVAVFGGAVTTLINHITESELIDSQSAMNLLVEAFPDDNKRRDGRGWMPLHWAAAIHDTEPDNLKIILESRPFNACKGHLHIENAGEVGANAQSYRGLVPLHFAASVQHPNIQNIITLIEANTDVLAYPDHRGWLPIHWCAYNCRDVTALKLLIKHYDEGVFTVNKKGKLPFQLSGYNRCVDIMDELYRVNPDAVEGLDYNGNTPMHDAVKSFNPEGVAKLFMLKYDLGRIRNFKEQLPIHKAFSYIPDGSSRLHSRHLQTINTLLRMNPETASLADLNDSLPLHLAVYFNASLDVVQAVYNGTVLQSSCIVLFYRNFSILLLRGVEYYLHIHMHACMHLYYFFFFNVSDTPYSITLPSFHYLFMFSLACSVPVGHAVQRQHRPAACALRDQPRGQEAAAQGQRPSAARWHYGQLRAVLHLKEASKLEGGGA